MRRSLHKIIDRLKVVPLTILLTVLLWWYADANLTSTAYDLPIHTTVMIAAGAGGNRTLQMVRPADGEFQVSIQGPRNRVDWVRRQSNGQAMFTREDLSGLAYVVAHPERLKLGSDNALNALRVFQALPYFHRQGVSVIGVQPQIIQLRVDETVTVTRPVLFRALRHVPVKISPATAQVTLPNSLLQTIGGPDQLKVIAKPLQDLTALPPDKPQSVQAQLEVRFPGPANAAVNVSPATVQVALTLPPQPRQKLFLGIVPVWTAGPPWLLDRYRVQVRPNTLEVTVAGPRPALDRLRHFLLMGNEAPLRDRVVAVLQVTPAWIPTTGWVTHAIHYELPREIRLVNGPDNVQCRVLWHGAAASHTATATMTQPPTTANVPR